MRSNLLIGIDIGGTKIQAGLVNGAGKVLTKFRTLTEAYKGRKTILVNIDKCLKAVWRPDVRAIGVGFAGLVDFRKGIITGGPNFPKSFKDVPLAAWLRRKYGVTAAVNNDVHCFALGEARFGAGRGHDNIVGVTLGTGIGGALIINGHLYRGLNNAAGEFGHMTVADGNKARCGCGHIGHFEALAAGPAQSASFLHATGKKLLPTDIEALAKTGDKKALRNIEAAGRWLGIGLANVIQVVDPDIIIVGGGISRNKLLWPPMRRSMKENVIYPSLRSTPIVPAQLGDDANIIGAALLAEKR
jgi:glucokinase